MTNVTSQSERSPWKIQMTYLQDTGRTFDGVPLKREVVSTYCTETDRCLNPSVACVDCPTYRALQKN